LTHLIYRAQVVTTTTIIIIIIYNNNNMMPKHSINVQAVCHWTNMYNMCLADGE